VRTTVTAARSFSSQPTFLPLIYPVTSLDVKGKWLADQDLMVYSTDSSIAGQSYTENSLNVDPSTGQLQQLGKLANTAGLGPDLALPASYKTQALTKLAENHVSGQTSEIGEVTRWPAGSRERSSITPWPAGVRHRGRPVVVPDEKTGTATASSPRTR